MPAAATITVADALAAAEGDLALPGTAARLEAEVLLAAACNRDRSWLYGHGDRELEHAALRDFRRAVARRAQGEPIAHITGRREFWSMNLRVTPDTLIPRPETELLVETALALLPATATPRILDLGTGTGAIALALSRERPAATITASDVSPPALEVARANSAEYGIGKVRFLESDWFDALDAQVFDLIVCNPPYVADDDQHLLQGDCRFEPRLALAAGRRGLDALQIVIACAPAHLAAGGFLLVEHGYDQREAVVDLLTENGFLNLEHGDDLAGHPRMVTGRKG